LIGGVDGGVAGISEGEPIDAFFVVPDPVQVQPGTVTLVSVGDLGGFVG
jgi:hypothetical protein